MTTTHQSHSGLIEFLGQAYTWLCASQVKARSNHGIWHLRWNSKQLLAKLKESLNLGLISLSPVKLVQTKDSSFLECWESQDTLIIKALALSLQQHIEPQLSSQCYHLKGRGGVKSATHKVRQLIRSGRYSHVARSDAKGYYANIQHTKLLELLRAKGGSSEELSLVSQYCNRLRVKDGYYAETQKGISLGSPLSPLMGALYLSPLDVAMEKIRGVKYIRFMDDWVILAESRWKLRGAVRVMNQRLATLGLEQHPDKTFIGRLERGFDFLGIQFTGRGERSPSAVSIARHTEKTTRLYGELWKLVMLLQENKTSRARRLFAMDSHPLEKGNDAVRSFSFLSVGFPLKDTSSACKIQSQITKTAAFIGSRGSLEQGASRERIETYKQNWQRYLRGILGDAVLVTKKSKEPPSSTALHSLSLRPNVKPTLAPAVLFSRDHSLHPKSEMEDNNNRQRKHNENKTKQIGELLCNTRSSSS